ncbi:hypothetical protein [Ancylobacter dichloromethanicus]
MKTTILNCHALTGENATPTPAPVDIEIEGRLITEVRPAGAREPAAGTVIDGREL